MGWLSCELQLFAPSSVIDAPPSLALIITFGSFGLIQSWWLSPCRAFSWVNVCPPSIDFSTGAFITYTTFSFCGSAVMFM